jgi:hypothetical protein
MLAVQLGETKIARLIACLQVVKLLVVATAAIGSVILAASSPCSYRQRIWISGFSLGDQCIVSPWP